MFGKKPTISKLMVPECWCSLVSALALFCVCLCSPHSGYCSLLGFSGFPTHAGPVLPSCAVSRVHPRALAFPLLCFLCFSLVLCLARYLSLSLSLFKKYLVLWCVPSWKREYGRLITQKNKNANQFCGLEAGNWSCLKIANHLSAFVSRFCETST